MSEDDIIAMMVGRELKNSIPTKPITLARRFYGLKTSVPGIR